MTTPSLILVGMSVSDVNNREELVRVARARGAGLAFLQMGDPSLSAELTRVADAGAETVTLVGMDAGPLGPGQSWLARIAAHWWRERAGAKPQISVATRLAADSNELDAVLAEVKALTGGEAGLTSAAWENVSGHRYHVLVCRGPRCTAMGQVDNLRALILAMVRSNLGDDDVLLTHTGCQFPCNQAPVINVQPDDVWYGHVDPEVADAIVSEHLVCGSPVDRGRLPR